MTRVLTYKQGRRLRRGLLHLALILTVAWSIVPLMWVFSTSLKPSLEVLEIPPHWIPRTFTLDEYRRLIQNEMFYQTGKNSVIVTGVTTLLTIVIGSAGAYAFACLRFPYKNVLLLLILLARMVPGITLVVPMYVLLNDLGLVNTRAALILTYLSWTLPFAIWFLHGFYSAIPPEIEGAARIFGCSRLRAWATVLLPMIAPGLVATGIYVGILAWNDFLFAFVLTMSPDAQTLPVALMAFRHEFLIDWGQLCAGTFAVALPVIISAFIVQRYLVQGLTAGAIK